MFSCVIRNGLPMNVSGLEGDEETVVPMWVACCLLGYSLVCVDFSND
jgi:hypothetical protein